MSRKSNNPNQLEVRFVEGKGSDVFDAIKFFEKIYRKNTRVKNVRKALQDFHILFKFFNVHSFEGLLKELNMQINK